MKQNEYLNALAQLISTDIQYGIVGTGSTTPTQDDGGLETPDASTDKFIEYSVSNNSVTFTYTLRSTDTNITATEFGLKKEAGTDATFISRDVFPATTKDGTVDLVIEKTFFIQ